MRLMRLSLSKPSVVFVLSFLGALTVAAVVVITYFPSLGIGFWMDDYINLDTAGRFSGVEYLVKFFDPRIQRLWYRPMIGIQWKIEYLLFRGEPLGYHLVHAAIHLVDSLLLYWLVKRITQKWRIGFVAALLFATLPLSSMAVYWPSVHDPLAGIFYLLTILLWMDYLESGSRLKLGLTYALFVGALLTKEISATLPGMLFLADRLLVKKPAHLTVLLKRYALFSVVLLIYAVLEFIVITRSVFTQQVGYGVGEHIFPVFLQYLTFLAFPWDLDQPLRSAWLIGMILLFLYGCWRERTLLFLGAAGILPTLVASPIPLHLINPRYLYLPLMASAAGFSLLLEVAARAAQNFRWVWARAVTGLIVAFVVFGSASIAERTENHGGFIRQLRLQFRPIYQWHPSFAPDTFLYFLDTPLQTLDISGLMFLRYGANVSVGGVDRAVVGGLRDHRAAFVYYLDDKNQFREQAVDPSTTVQITPALPARFGNSLSLDALEVASTQAKRGEAVIVLLYWKTTGRIDKDYKVFAHLLNEKDEIVAGADSQPRRGNAPTSSWRLNSLVVDWVVIPITNQIAAGQKYRIELGMYYEPTMERLGIIDGAGRAVTDHLTLEPFSISE